jgi:hypothetical protein
MRIAKARRLEMTAAHARARAAGERPTIVSALDDPEVIGSIDHLPFMGGGTGRGTAPPTEHGAPAGGGLIATVQTMPCVSARYSPTRATREARAAGRRWAAARVRPDGPAAIENLCSGPSPEAGRPDGPCPAGLVSGRADPHVGPAAWARVERAAASELPFAVVGSTTQAVCAL